MAKREQILPLFFVSSFQEAIFSHREKKAELPYQKVTIHKIENHLFQFSFFDGNKVKHWNRKEGEMERELAPLFRDFRQLLLRGEKEYHIIKHGAEKYHVVENENFKPMTSLTHNRVKQYILQDGDPLDFLVEQGVMSGNYRVKANMQHKFRQINRFLEFIRDIVPDLPTDRPIEIVDFGCGKSYLTFAIYYYFEKILQREVHIHGLDLKEDVICDCNRLKEKLHYEHLSFQKGDIAQYQEEHPIDLMVTLHACDTATDYALYHAIMKKTKVILSVPCCQHELHFQMHDTPLDALFRFGILQERTAAILTDGLRAMMLEASGYKTQILEFIDMEHTPKNLLIRAVYSKPHEEKWMEVEKILEAYHISPTLYQLLRGKRK